MDIGSTVDSKLELEPEPEPEPELEPEPPQAPMVAPPKDADLPPGPDGALLLAASSGSIAAADVALRDGARLDAVDGQERATSLFMAARNGHSAVVGLLLDARAAVDVPRLSDGVTPLMTSCIRGHFDAAKLLVRAGADITLTVEACGGLSMGQGSVTTWTALQWAKAKGYSTIVELLRSNPNPPMMIPEGVPLRHVAERSCEDAVCAYGFSRERASAALAARNGDVEEAVRLLLADKANAARPTCEPEPVPDALADDPAVAEYTRDGITVRGLRHAIKLLGHGAITSETTTNEMCQIHVKPLTIPRGWTDEPELITLVDGKDVSKNGWYNHVYLEHSTGVRTTTPPSNTRSFCRLLASSATTASFVGKPTHFLSHAWSYRVLNLIDAIEGFVESLPEGSPEPVFWFDCFSLDQHSHNDKGSDWWRTTFKAAIGSMGHTVMVLSPWQSPIPLTRSWCLWELFCTVDTSSEFSVCLGASDQTEFEIALMQDPDVVLAAFAKIDVVNASAGSDTDRAIILKEASQIPGGTDRLNEVGLSMLREWIKSVVRSMARKVMHDDGVALLKSPRGTAEPIAAKAEQTVNKVGVVLAKLGEPAEARKLFEASVASTTTRCGPQHFSTLQALNGLATQMQATGDDTGAATIYERVLAGCRVKLGRMHVNTLSVQMNLANLLSSGSNIDATMYERCHHLYDEVIEGRTNALGPRHEKTLEAQMNLVDLQRAQGNLAEARALCERVVDGYNANPNRGPSHVSTLLAQMNLAVILMRMKGQQTKAQHLLELVISKFTTQLGASHLRTLTAKSHLAALLCAPQDVNLDTQCPAGHQLIPFMTDGLFCCDKCKLGVDCAVMMYGCRACDYDICVACSHREGLPGATQAKALYKSVLTGETAQLGRMHANTLATKHQLARLLFRTGELVAAHEMMRETVALLSKVKGSAHPQTQVAQEDLDAIAASCAHLEASGVEDTIQVHSKAEQSVRAFLQRFSAEDCTENICEALREFAAEEQWLVALEEMAGSGMLDSLVAATREALDQSCPSRVE